MRLLLQLSDDFETELFIEQWNSDESCMAVGVAQSPEPAERFDLPLLAVATLVVLEGVSLGVSANAVYDLVLGKLRRTSKKRLSYEELTLPDGTRYIRIEESTEL